MLHVGIKSLAFTPINFLAADGSFLAVLRKTCSVNNLVECCFFATMRVGSGVAAAVVVDGGSAKTDVHEINNSTKHCLIGIIMVNGT